MHATSEYYVKKIAELEAAIQRVRDLHTADDQFPAECTECEGGTDWVGGIFYPCPTIIALDEPDGTR